MEAWADAGKELTDGLFDLLENVFTHEEMMNRVLPRPYYCVLVDKQTLLKYSLWIRYPLIEWDNSSKSWKEKWPPIPEGQRLAGTYSTQEEAANCIRNCEADKLGHDILSAMYDKKQEV